MARKRSSAASQKGDKEERASANPRSEGADKATKGQKGRIDDRIDPEQSKRSALLQLKIGRASQIYGMVAGASLVFSGVLLLLTPVDRPLGRLPDEAKLLLPWFAPILTGAFIAASTVGLKWKPYAHGRLSLHFLISVLAFLGSVGTLLALIFQVLKGLKPENIGWLYPASFSGISLSLISLAMTWRGLSRRKMISIAMAGFPMAIMVYGSTPIFSGGIPQDLLILTFMGGAFAVLYSGSMLHIIASSTSIQEREILKASDDKLMLIRDELRARAEALDYKEDALRAKEADIEAYEKSIAQRIAALDQHKKHLDSTASQMERRTKELKEFEKMLSSRQAQVEAKAESLTLKEQDLASQVQKWERAQKELQRHEKLMLEKEGEIKKGLIDLAAREKDLASRTKEAEDLERKHGSLQKHLEAMREELLRKEKDLEIREKGILMQMETIQATAGKLDDRSKRFLDLRTWENRILQKEKELGNLEVRLKALNQESADRMERSKSVEQKLGVRMSEARRKEEELTTREKTMADKERGYEAKMRDLNRQLQLLEESVASLKDKEKRYQQLTLEARSKVATATTSKEELKREMASIEERETRLKDIEAGLKREHEALLKRHKEVLQKEKDLEARESEIKLRTMEFDSRMRGAMAAGAAEAPSALREREKALELWERRLKEKEQELRNRFYQKEKELQERERLLHEDLKEEITEMVQVTPEETKANKVKTGTPRLDDLLLGGIPMNSHVLFVGPAFVGKEVGILSFIAEGLKRGIPAVIVITSKPPVEISKEMGPILPSFKEYEQLGLVKWIDASTPMTEAKKKTPVLEKDRFVVNGGGDFEGILKAINLIDEEFKAKEYPYFRLGYMTLSTSITQTGEKEAFNFIQMLVNRLRQTRSVGVYAVERGMHSDQQIEALEHQMDGALDFKVDRAKNFLKVQGVCEVQTKDWVEYKHTNRSLMIGAFSLERIR